MGMAKAKNRKKPSRSGRREIGERGVRMCNRKDRLIATLTPRINYAEVNGDEEQRQHLR